MSLAVGLVLTFLVALVGLPWSRVTFWWKGAGAKPVVAWLGLYLLVALAATTLAWLSGWPGNKSAPEWVRGASYAVAAQAILRADVSASRVKSRSLLRQLSEYVQNALRSTTKASLEAEVRRLSAPELIAKVRRFNGFLDAESRLGNRTLAARYAKVVAGGLTAYSEADSIQGVAALQAALANAYMDWEQVEF